MALALFAGGGCLLWIPIIGWVLAPILLIAAAVVALSGVFPTKNVWFRCHECKALFQVAKSNLVGPPK